MTTPGSTSLSPYSRIASKRSKLRQRRESSTRRELERDWRSWLTALFPSAFTAPWADHQAELWDWLWSIRLGERPPPFVAIWPRGGGKSTATELAAVATGALGTRRYVLYVSETQRQADDHVHTVARRLESVLFADLYDEMASRALSKYGHSLGWRRNRLLTESDFVVDAIGLDVARRGAKLHDERPDFIIFDDLDARHDGPELVQRKIATLTDSILPAGSDDVAILGVQNLVQPEGIFARLAGVAEEPADFLVDRVPTRIIPAVWDLEVEQSPDGVRIVDGEPSWDGAGPGGVPARGRQHRLLGLPARDAARGQRGRRHLRAPGLPADRLE